jgi:hypothetical protein
MVGPVFISHSEKDRSFSDALLHALESRDIQCWIAPRDIPPGGSYAEAIMTAIEQCSCLVLIYTERCNGSGHVLREVERALKFSKNIVPIRFDESAPSRSLDYLLATVHWLSVTGESIEAGVARVAEQVASCVNPVATAPRPAPSPTVMRRAAPVPDAETVPPSRRPAVSIPLLVGCIALALILGLLLVRSFWQPRPAESPPDRAMTKELQSPAATAPAVAATPEATASRVTVAVSSPAVPAQPAAVPAADPKDILYRYYARFEEREPAAAYSLLSAKFKAKLSYKKFSETFATTRAMRLLESRVINSSESSVTVAVILEETEADSKHVQWEGPIELAREPDGWRIDTMRDLRKRADPSSGAASGTKLAVATSPPARTPALSWDRPRIHLELANNAQRNKAAELKRRLTSSGYVVVTINDASDNVDVPIEASELRYFTPTDSAEAQRIAQELKPILGNIVAYLPEGMPYVSHARQYEIWLSKTAR